MSDLCVWLERILVHGESVQTAAPDFHERSISPAIKILNRTFDTLALDLAGPAIRFDANVAFFAMKNLAAACWQIASNQSEPVIDHRCEPQSPSCHLSADVTLRLLPTLYRRAKVRGADYSLLTELDRLARTWPLSGVRLDLEGLPNSPLDFYGHIGLQQLYSERLISSTRAGWVPQNGLARQWTEVVFTEHRRLLPKLISGDVDD